MLFLLRSRTSLYLFLLTLVVYGIFRYGKKALVVLVLGIIIASFTGFNDSIVQISPATQRMLFFILKKEDSSWNSRKELLSEGIKMIRKNWVWGDYAGQVRVTGSLGSYIHNYLSLWRQFGVFPFLAFLLLNLYCMSNCYRIYKYRSKKKITDDIYITGLFFCCLYFFLLGEVVFSRAYVSPYIWLAFGFNTRFSGIFSKDYGFKKLTYGKNPMSLLHKRNCYARVE